jgi:hypothetical protein
MFGREPIAVFGLRARTAAVADSHLLDGIGEVQVPG